MTFLVTETIDKLTWLKKNYVIDQIRVSKLLLWIGQVLQEDALNYDDSPLKEKLNRLTMYFMKNCFDELKLNSNPLTSVLVSIIQAE